MSENRTELHILNGDYALELWKKCGFSGESLVWRETYLEGPLPETDDQHTFWEARAEYLSTFDELNGVSPARLYQHLKKMDETLLDLPGNSEIMLWFDSCIFDQTLLLRILSLLNRKQTDLPEISLYCCSGNALNEADFQTGIRQRMKLQKNDLETAEKAWHFFQRKDADGLQKLSEEADFERIPSMKKALRRCTEEIRKDQHGLNRTQRQIIELIKQGKRSFSEIFTGLDHYEELPFLGDTACQRILNSLVEKGLLIPVHGTYNLPE